MPKAHTHSALYPHTPSRPAVTVCDRLLPSVTVCYQVSLPQLRAMHPADQKRKRTLVEHGFRLPSALDNRPLSEQEFFLVPS